MRRIKQRWTWNRLVRADGMWGPMVRGLLYREKRLKQPWCLGAAMQRSSPSEALPKANTVFVRSKFLLRPRLRAVRPCGATKLFRNIRRARHAEAHALRRRRGWRAELFERRCGAAPVLHRDPRCALPDCNCYVLSGVVRAWRPRCCSEQPRGRCSTWNNVHDLSPLPVPLSTERRRKPMYAALASNDARAHSRRPQDLPSYRLSSRLFFAGCAATSSSGLARGCSSMKACGGRD